MIRTKRHRSAAQTATEYMLIISVVVIACVAAAYMFVPQFEQGVVALGKDVSRILATGQLGQRGGGGGGGGGGSGDDGMGSGSTARVSSRLCDENGRDLDPRYAAMFDPPPCVMPAPTPKAWSPSVEPAPPMTTAAPRASKAMFVAPSRLGEPAADPVESAPACEQENVLWLGSAKLGRRSRSR